MNFITEEIQYAILILSRFLNRKTSWIFLGTFASATFEWYQGREPCDYKYFETYAMS